MLVWFLVTTGILLSCRVSGKPISMAFTGGMTSDDFPSTPKEDTYLRFQPRTKSAAPNTDDTTNRGVLQDSAVSNENNDVNDTPTVASSNVIQSVPNDRKDTSVPSSKINELNNDMKTKKEERSQERDEIRPYVDDNRYADTQSIENGDIYGKQTDKDDTLQSDGKVNDKAWDEYSASQSTINGNIYGDNVDKEAAVQNIDDENLYNMQGGENEDLYGNQEEKVEVNSQINDGVITRQSITNDDIDDKDDSGEQGDSEVYEDPIVAAANLKDDDVMSRVSGTQASEAPIVDNKEDASPNILESNVDVTKDNRETLNDGDSNQEYGKEAVDADTSRDDNEDNDIDPGSVTAEEVSDLDEFFNILTKILDGDMPENRYAISNTTEQVIDNQDSELQNGRHLDSGKVYLHSQPGSAAPKEMTQSDEKTEEKDEQEYPRFQAVINISQTENSDTIDLDEISERVISEVESLALPLLQIAQDTRASDNTDVSKNREVNPRGFVIFEDTNGDTTLAIKENNGNKDSLDEPMQTINEISIIHSL